MLLCFFAIVKTPLASGIFRLWKMNPLTCLFSVLKITLLTKKTWIVTDQFRTYPSCWAYWAYGCNLLWSFSFINMLMPPFLSTYCPSHSTEAVIHLCNEIATARSNNLLTCVSLIEFSSAFDIADLAILTECLISSFGFTGSELQWFTSYLNKRFQSVRLNSQLFVSFFVSYGASQGSVLGLYLFHFSRHKTQGRFVKQKTIFPSIFCFSLRLTTWKQQELKTSNHCFCLLLLRSIYHFGANFQPYSYIRLFESCKSRKERKKRDLTWCGRPSRKFRACLNAPVDGLRQRVDFQCCQEKKVLRQKEKNKKYEHHDQGRPDRITIGLINQLIALTSWLTSPQI